MSTYIIYKTTNLVNGKIYVGQHNTSANDGYLGSGLILKSAIEKYGKDKFIRESLEFCVSTNVNKREIYWIKKLNSTDIKIGYNIHEGGTGGKLCDIHPCKGRTGKNAVWFGKKHSEKTKLMLSEKAKGRKHSNETRNKMKISHTGKIKGPMSTETKIKLSEGRNGNKHWNWGKKFSEKTKRKISESQRKEKHSQNKYIFILSNGQNYWDLPKNMRNNINGKFKIKKTDIIEYKDITIKRRLKNE